MAMGDKSRGKIVFDWFDAAATEEERVLTRDSESELGQKKIGADNLQTIVRMRLASEFTTRNVKLPPSLSPGKDLKATVRHALAPCTLAHRHCACAAWECLSE